MAAQKFAVGANDKVYIRTNGVNVFAVQSHGVDEQNNSKRVYGYGSRKAIGVTQGAQEWSVKIDALVPLTFNDDQKPLYLLLREPGAELVRVIGEWKTVLKGLDFESHSESGTLDSINESITLIATERQDFFKDLPVDFDTAVAALGG